ncbi:MAG: hypothetical protein R2798_06550 [Chitinophagales bacterium]|nr:hypothetical protein [Bacteroidota bacterium]MCB9043702.1 hypothetical protein [Chitinophagales bacterium]
MKKILTYLVCVLFMATSVSYAQEIIVQKSGGKYKFIQNNTILKNNELARILASNPESSDLFYEAKTAKGAGLFLGVPGGFIVGYEVVNLFRNNANRDMLAIGLCLSVVSMMFTTSSNKKFLKAVDAYNDSLSSSSFYKPKPVFKVFAGVNSLGLSMTF